MSLYITQQIIIVLYFCFGISLFYYSRILKKGLFEKYKFFPPVVSHTIINFKEYKIGEKKHNFKLNIKNNNHIKTFF